jgi:hypothetical protein
MASSRQYREKAAAYRGLFEESKGLEQRQELQELERSFTTLADNEQWVENNYGNMVHAPASDGLGNISANEDRMLRYLGAALILQWNTLPAKLQRELFDSAGAMGEILDTGELRGQIARFLHNHKNDGK